MSETAQQLLSTMLALPREDREYLWQHLTDSLEETDDEEDAALLATLNRRIEEMRNDPSKRIPAREVLARLRAKFK